MQGQVKVIACSDRVAGLQPQLERNLAAEGIPFIWEQIEPFSWRKRVEFEQRMALKYEDDNLVVVDPWDTVFVGRKDELTEIVARQQILWHGEKVCWPDASNAAKHPTTPYPYRFASGCPAGIGWALSNAIEWGKRVHPIVGDSADINSDNTNRFYMDVFLAAFGQVDVRAELWMPMTGFKEGDAGYRNKRWYNNLTGVYPQFVHFNGASKHHFRKMAEEMADGRQENVEECFRVLWLQRGVSANR